MTPELISILALSLTTLALIATLWIQWRMVKTLFAHVIRLEERLRVLEHVTHDHRLNMR